MHILLENLFYLYFHIFNYLAINSYPYLSKIFLLFRRNQSTDPSFHLFIYHLSIHLSIYTYISIYPLSIYLYIHLSMIYLSISLYIYISIYLYLYIYLFRISTAICLRGIEGVKAWIGQTQHLIEC